MFLNKILRLRKVIMSFEIHDRSDPTLGKVPNLKTTKGKSSFNIELYIINIMKN